MKRALQIGVSLLATAAILMFCHGVLRVNNTTVALTLLLAVLLISTLWGMAEALAASLLAALGFNFYFLPPVGKLTIHDPQDFVAFFAFLATATIASQLATHARRRAADAEARRVEMERLYALVQAMLMAESARKTASEFVHNVAPVFGCAAAAFYDVTKGEVFRSGPESAAVSDAELQTATEGSDAFVDERRGVGLAPVRLGGRKLGSLAVIGEPPSAQTLRAIANLAAIALERARAVDDASRAESERQSEALKSALLDSLAHDINTPLTSIKAAATSLLTTSAADQKELLTIIDEETDRLNRLASEVIAMARIEAGKLHLEKQPVAVPELVAAALETLPAAGRAWKLDISDHLPLADADPEYAAQVVRQLAENAIKYSPAGSPIGIAAGRRDGKIVISVSDRGPGIEDNERTRIFDRFFRGRRHRFDTKGTGMGLAIAKGIAEAHGGRIWVESEPGEGSVFYFSLPVSGGLKA
ncbi:MAG TPA: ATP-binding protein [Bryobacteraceae bacterium]|jgi:two-component system sensor histidine kinase KdpD|nr:ATP-binding protein [Bryobacteraceae bacterium]